MYCKKCGKEVEAVLRKDNRGVVDAYCPECGAHIKKVSSAELLDRIEAIGKYVESLKKPVVVADLRPSTPCKYCAEHFFYQCGRLGNVYRPLLDAKYCPMCGRRLTGHERDY